MSDKGKEQWARVPFNVSHNIFGCDVVFGDSHNRSPRPTRM